MKEQSKLYGLDHLRALAILMVWFFHYQNGVFGHPQWTTTFTVGWTGVDYWAMYLYYPTYCRLDGLLAGVAIAAVYQFLPKTWERISKYGNQLILLSILLMVIAFFFLSKLYTYSSSIFGFPFISLVFGFMVAGALSPSSFLYKWKSNTTTLIATLSYGIYLTHKGIIHMVQEIFSNWGIEKDSSIMVVISLFFCVLVAWLLHLAVEKPFMKMREQFLKPVIQAIPIPVPVETSELLKERSRS